MSEWEWKLSLYLQNKYIAMGLNKSKTFGLKKVKKTIYAKSLHQHQQFKMITQFLQRGNQLIRWMILEKGATH